MKLYLVYSCASKPEEGAGLVYAEDVANAISTDYKSGNGYANEYVLETSEMTAVALDLDAEYILSANDDLNFDSHVIKDPVILRLAGMWDDFDLGECEYCGLHEWLSVPSSALCGDCLRCVECGHDDECQGTRPVEQA